MTSETIDSILSGLIDYKISYGDLKQGLVRLNLNKKDMIEFRNYINSPEYLVRFPTMKFTPTKKERYRGVISGVFVLIVPTQSPESTVAISFNIDRILLI